MKRICCIIVLFLFVACKATKHKNLLRNCYLVYKDQKNGPRANSQPNFFYVYKNDTILMINGLFGDVHICDMFYSRGNGLDSAYVRTFGPEIGLKYIVKKKKNGVYCTYYDNRKPPIYLKRYPMNIGDTCFWGKNDMIKPYPISELYLTVYEKDTVLKIGNRAINCRKYIDYDRRYEIHVNYLDRKTFLPIQSNIITNLPAFGFDSNTPEPKQIRRVYSLRCCIPITSVFSTEYQEQDVYEVNNSKGHSDSTINR